MQLALLCSVLNFSIQDNNDASFKEIFPPHMLKQQEKMGLKHYVTKLTRLHYHLGFYVYATLLFFFFTAFNWLWYAFSGPTVLRVSVTFQPGRESLSS